MTTSPNHLREFHEEAAKGNVAKAAVALLHQITLTQLHSRSTSCEDQAGTLSTILKHLDKPTDAEQKAIKAARTLIDLRPAA